MLNKITVFQCDTCKRQIELELDDNRPYPSRCAITYKCPGLYNKVGEKNSRSTLFPPIVYGLQDYIPRGSTITVIPDDPANPLVSILAGTNQLVLAASSKETIQSADAIPTYDNWAVENVNSAVTPLFLYAPDVANPTNTSPPKHPGLDNVLLLELYQLDIQSTAFTEYYFLRPGPISQISGSDDSTTHSVLRFNGGDNLNDTNLDNITVFVNGVEVPRINSAEATETGKYFMSVISGSGEHSIKFVPTLVSTSNVIKIYVYKKPALLTDPTKIITLVFRGQPDNAVSRSSNSWGDTTRVTIDYQLSSSGVIDRFLYTCNNFETLPASPSLILNNRYLVKDVKAIRSTGAIVQLDPDDIHLLFGQSPYSFVDKVADLTLNMKEAINADSSTILQFNEDEFGNINIYTELNNLSNMVDDVKGVEFVDTSILVNSGASIVNQEDTIISSKYIIGYV